MTIDNFFEPKGLGLSIHQERYAHGNETWSESCDRVARVVASAEENGKAEVYKNRFYEMLVKGLFSPGGRIWNGAGRPVQQLLNCFVLPTGDSREAWGKSINDMLIVSGVGGGIGANFSPIRGRGYAVKGTGGVSTGAVSLMQMWDKVGDILVSGGGRRLALMLSLDIDHPDIEEFLNVKLDLDELNNANISIILPPHLTSEEFQTLVAEDGDIELRFGGLPDKLGRKIKARELWTKLVQNAWQSGEPGFLNMSYANKMNNIYYHKPLLTTNPCGEICLESYGCCDLGALVLPRFVVDGKMRWADLEETVRLGVRFLDNVLDVNHYPIQEIEDNCKQVRRIGLGVMGLHSMLLDLGMKYDSDEAFEFVDKLMAFIKNTAYDASIMLAVEKGAFPAYDPKFTDSGFMKTVKPAIRRKVKEYGIRNCAMLTIAPTGTTSMVQGVTGGVEPLFSPVYIRRRKTIDSKAKEVRKKTLVVSQEYLDHPDLVQGAYDIDPRGHLEMQKIVQKHLDNACSKCIAEGTLIPTNRGLVPIEKIGKSEIGQFGDPNMDYEVIGHDGKQHKITSFYTNGFVDTIRMRTETGAIIEGSMKHKMLTTEGWKQMPDLRIGDAIIGRFSEMHGEGNLPINFDFVMRSNAKDVNFPVKMSVDLAKWLGMMCADGHTVESSGNVGLTAKSKCGNPESEFIRLSSIFNINQRDTIDNRSGVVIKSMTSRNLVRYVEKLIGKGAGNKHIPEQILQGSAEEKIAFLSGLTLDGYVSPKGLTIYSGISKQLADETECLCRSFGLPKVYRYTETKNDGYQVHSVIVTNQMQDLIIPIEEHKRRKSTFFSWLVPTPKDVYKLELPSSHSEYSNLRSLKQRQPLYCKNTTLDKLGVEYDKKIYITKVSSLEKSATMTYDIEVEEAHSYVVNGLISHNTINLPEDFPVEDLADLWLEYLPYMKGSTFYRQGSRGEEPMEHVPAENMNKVIANWTEEIEYEQPESMECPTGVCEVPNILATEVEESVQITDNTE